MIYNPKEKKDSILRLDPSSQAILIPITRETEAGLNPVSKFPFEGQQSNKPEQLPAQIEFSFAQTSTAQSIKKN